MSYNNAKVIPLPTSIILINGLQILNNTLDDSASLLFAISSETHFTGVKPFRSNPSTNPSSFQDPPLKILISGRVFATEVAVLITPIVVAVLITPIVAARIENILFSYELFV